ncbi:HAD-like protein [Imleria badia]|nr:HAD-like protein [Imleria badia]
MAAHLSFKEDYESSLDQYDTWMFDCDGVLWHGDCPIDGAVEVLDNLRKRGKRLLFVTNDARKSRKSYKNKFDQPGVQATVDEIHGSAIYAAAVYASSVIKLPKDKKVYVIEMSGLKEELREEGIASIEGTDPADNTLEPFSLANFTLDRDVAAVLCGLDFLVTNDDSTYPSADGVVLGAGSTSAPLRFVLRRDPICIGKPAKTMLDFKLDPTRTIVAGGLATFIVLTGITSKEDITGPNITSPRQ